MKISLNILCVIPVLAILVESFIDATNIFDFFENIVNFILFFPIARPWYLLSLIPLFIILLIPNKELKKQNKELKYKKVIWIILLILGICPFVLILSRGIYDAINGYSFMCFLDCNYTYGIKGFCDSVLTNAFFSGGLLVLGFVLIIISIIKLKIKR